MNNQLLTWFLGAVGTIIGGILLVMVRRIWTSIDRIDSRDRENALAQGRCEAQHDEARRRLHRLEERCDEASQRK